MTDELKPIRCGCGGEAKVYVYSMDGGFWHRYNVECTKCNVRTPKYDTEAEAVQAWNRAISGSAEEKLKAFWDGMSAEMKAESAEQERTAKVVDKSVGRHSISDFDWTGKCEICGNEIQYSFDFYPYCGAKLDWSENE